MMAKSTGARSAQYERTMHWPGGEHVWWPTHDRTMQVPDRTPVLLYLHGGGFIACSPTTHRPLVSSLVRRLGGEAFVPSYRLAPEHPHPAALDDARNAYVHLIEDRGIDPARIIIAGDSAGGGLALALTMALRDQGTPLPAGVLLFSPWTDMTGTSASLDENSDSCAMFAGETIRRASRFYVGDGDPFHPMLSPVFGNFDGLPPLLVHACQDEVLRDDATRVAERARDAGVVVSLRLWRHVPHVWQFFAAVLPEARESLSDATAFVREVMMPGGATPDGERVQPGT
ncbi:MAG TPA: alpha/beta hydrolase [Gemmatimonas sp.]|nr:alpha/beta hydrolase [Gemmatimonas sp.]